MSIASKHVRNWFFAPLQHGFLVLVMALTCACVKAPPAYYGESNTCDASKYESGHPECLPQPGFFCEDPPDESEEVSTTTPDPQYMGQLFPSKQSLGGNQPICPPNSTRLVQEEDRKLVKKGAHELGRQVGVIMATCQNIIEQLTYYPDGTLKNWHATHPQSMANVLNECADELAKIPELPELDDVWLNGTAKAAFEEGYGAGMDEVANRLLILELAVDTIELIIFPELMLAEVALTRAIRSSITALRRMPIFIPGAVMGVGGIVTLAPKVAKTVVRGSSRVLGRALKKAGKIRLLGEFAHHIVAHGDHRAKKALEILDKYGIGVDEAVNGVFLPGYKSSPNPHGKVVHGNLHTDAYYMTVERRLAKAATRADAEQILRKLAWELEHGIIPQ